MMSQVEPLMEKRSRPMMSMGPVAVSLFWFVSNGCELKKAVHSLQVSTRLIMSLDILGQK